MPLIPLRRHAALLGASLVVTVAASSTLDAQGAPATIPGPLAAAALSTLAGFFGATPRFVVDRVPPTWPAALSAGSPASVVGGLEMGGLSVAVFDYPTDTAAAFAHYRRVLEAAGWRRGTAPTPESGFQPTRTATPLPWCRDSAYLWLEKIESATPTTVIAVQRFSGAGGMFSPACGGGRRTITFRPQITTNVPQLTPPEGAKMLGGGTSSSGETTSLHTTIVSALPVERVIAHYATQLAAAGWQFGESATVDGAIMRRATKAEGEKRWAGLLTAYRAGPDVLIQLQVTPERTP
jgi:hypothetical protein